ncbi:hypothetical protein QVD17_11847 [Tagetes erecta]|uniref:Uncharacterized protein n=1 Tax=Tagetes erecta TaxID=13708 RepID=A0AAD8P197_TARER|nr:hypothetical protein QVD17_11847 [Tagetes erecta]
MDGLRHKIGSLGVPRHLFRSLMIHKISSTCGKIALEPDVSNLESNLALPRVPIVASSVVKINRQITIVQHEERFSCWVYEDNEEWIPSFMNMGSPSFSGNSDDWNYSRSSESDVTEFTSDVGSRYVILDKGPIENGPAFSNKNYDLNSDPFGLDPTIDKIMAQEKTYSDNNDGQSFSSVASKDFRADLGESGRKLGRKKLRLADLNDNLRDLSHFKLSRFLMTDKTKTHKKRGNSFNTLASEQDLRDHNDLILSNSTGDSKAGGARRSCPTNLGADAMNDAVGENKPHHMEDDLEAKAAIEQEVPR